MQIFTALGLMSGTSLDGLDIAMVKFTENMGNYNFELQAADTIAYTPIWKDKLSKADKLSGLELSLLNVELGSYFGRQINSFLSTKSKKIDFVASHGHTVFHQPENGLTLQIGSGAAISAACRIPVICDFRTTDVSLGGQGAPLVPIGDQVLFSSYKYCLNLGGIANVSFNDRDLRKAYDVCPVNMALNFLANSANLDFDKDGQLARSGSIDFKLLEQLQSLNYYKQKAPKSLGREWFEAEFLPLIANNCNIENTLATVVEHIALQVANQLNDENTLCTGGGALNTYLMERIAHYAKSKIVLAAPGIINYKEAIIFAFLGLLRLLEKPNCLSSVTGAITDNIGGAIYL